MESSVLNKLPEHLLSFTKVVIKNASSKRYWINKIKSLSYLDVAFVIVYFGAEFYEDILEFIGTTSEIYDEDHIKELDQYIEQFFINVSDINKDPKELGDMYLDEEFVKRLVLPMTRNEIIRQHFQNEEFCNTLLNHLCTFDQRLKKTTQELSDHVPVFPAYENIEYSFLPDAIHSLLGIRFLFITLLEEVTLNYKNVPLSYIENIVSVAKNPNVTFGLRKWITKLFDIMSLEQSNCMNILKAHSLTILKFYDIIQFEGRECEQATIVRLFEGIRGWNIFSGVPRELKQTLSEPELQLVKSEIYKDKLRILKSDFLTIITMFPCVYYKTKSLKTAATSTLLIGTSVIDFKKNRIIRNLEFLSYVLFVPYFKFLVISNNAIDICEELISNYLENKRVTPFKEYDDNECDQIIPSIDVINKSSH